MEYTELSLKERQDILRRVQSETGMDLGAPEGLHHGGHHQALPAQVQTDG